MIVNVPNHLIIGARSGFLTSLKETGPMAWARIAEQIDLTAKSTTLVDLGAAPMPTENKGRPQVQAWIEKTMDLKPKDWDITVGISYNEVQDDQSGILLRRVKSAGVNFKKHLNKVVFQTLNGGDGTTYGLCYDGQEFFDSDHADAGADYQTDQDNEFALALSPDNFATVRIAAAKALDDRGEETEYDYNLLVVPPDLRDAAAQICNNPYASDTANREINPNSGRVEYIESAQLDTTGWHLVASSESTKPLIVGMREAPSLQSSWFDPNAGNGGAYYFKFYARYNVVYGDWRLAFQGNT